MKSQLEFVKILHDRLHKDCKEYIAVEEKNRSYANDNYMNKNHGKTAIKRKITLLRQELLNLERMLEE